MQGLKADDGSPPLCRLKQSDQQWLVSSQELDRKVADTSDSGKSISDTAGGWGWGGGGGSWRGVKQKEIVEIPELSSQGKS